MLGNDDTMWSCCLAAGATEIVSTPRLVGIRGLCLVSTGSGPLLFRLKRHPITRNLPGAGPITYSGRRVLPHVDHILDTVINLPLPSFRAAACASQTIVSERPP